LTTTSSRDATALATVFALLFDLTPTEGWLLVQLATGDYVSRKKLRAALIRSGRSTASSTMAVFVHTMRKKLRPFGIEVATLQGAGYGLTTAARSKLRSRLAEYDSEILSTRSGRHKPLEQNAGNAS
jgi:biotin operon repressor